MKYTHILMKRHDYVTISNVTQHILPANSALECLITILSLTF